MTNEQKLNTPITSRTLAEMLVAVSEATIGLKVLTMSLSGPPLERARFHQARLERVKERLIVLLEGN